MTLKRRLVVWFALAAIGVGGYLALKAALPYYMQPAPCDQPCQELGDELSNPAELGKTDPDYRPKCSPLELTLELDKPEARVNQRYTLWYRLGLRNACCQDVFADISFFLGYQRAESRVIFKIWEPDGKEVQPGGWVREWEGVDAYATDLKDNPKVRSKTIRYSSYTLSPGEHVMASPDVFAPHERDIAGDTIEDWMKRTTDPKWLARYREMIRERTVRVRKVVTAMKPPAPPPGFRALDGYVFERPGDYRIQVVYDSVVYVKPRPSRIEGAALPLQLLMGLIGPERALGEARDYRVRIESPELVFKVAR